MKITWLLALVSVCLVFAGGCAGTQEQSAFSPKEAPTTLSKQVQVQVMANPEEVPVGKTPSEVLWEKAETEGMRQAINSWLRQRLLINVGQAASKQSRFLVHEGQFSPEKDEITNVYTQRFQISVDFTASTAVSGKITSFLDGRAMGGENSHCTIELADQTPDENGAYFLVTRPEEVQSERLMRIIGSGKIYNTINSAAQGLLTETNREIDVGDAVFLISGMIKPVTKEPEETPEATESESVDEVTVEPAMEPEPVEEPAEPK